MTDSPAVFGMRDGLPPSRHVDSITASLAAYSKAFEDAQKVRMAANLRGDEWATDLFTSVEKQLSNRLQKELKRHPLWPWLKAQKGLAGPRVARLIAIIGDPLRFPGQKCSMGHTLPPGFEVGQQCPVTADHRLESVDIDGGDDVSPVDGNFESDGRSGRGTSFVAADECSEFDSGTGSDNSSPVERTSEPDEERDRGTFPTHVDGADREPGSAVVCVGRMLPPRTTTGVGSLWHYLGLHVVEGKLPMRRKGRQADWHITGRSLVLGDKGIAAQIVMQRTPKYRDIYDSAKERLKERSPEWPPIRVEKVARTIAAKAFIGDLLVEWKRIVGEAESMYESGQGNGPSDDISEVAA